MQPDLFHYRENRGSEIDLIIRQAEEPAIIEIKSGAATTKDFFTNLKRFSERMQETVRSKT